MIYKENIKEKSIVVFDKYGNLLARCTLKRANKLIKRNCAKWIGDNKIELLVNDRDRKIIRNQIIEESGRICYICNQYIPENHFPTLDHVIPKSALGKDTKENLKCCCKKCNDDKSNKSLKEYVNHIKLNREHYAWLSDKQIEILNRLADTIQNNSNQVNLHRSC